jgi:hypothetical protein
MLEKLNKNKIYYLYLFCNNNYRYEYLKKSIELSNKYKNIQLIVIISAKNYKILNCDSFKRKLIKKYYFVKTLIYSNSKFIKLIKKHKVKFKYITDINSEIFIKQIKRPAIGIVAGFNQIFQKK